MECDGEPVQVSEDGGGMVSGTGAREQAEVWIRCGLLRSLAGEPCRMLLE